MKNIDYQNLLERALKTVVKEALRFAQINGLGGDSHFYLTFRTRDPGVIIPEFLKMRYPDTMTIVLQYTFTNLNVAEEEFGVQLTFDGRPSYIRIPYSALVEFKDPSNDFILEFHPNSGRDAGNDLELPLEEKPKPVERVVDLDEFRKKIKKNSE